MRLRPMKTVPRPSSDCSWCGRRMDDRTIPGQRMRAMKSAEGRLDRLDENDVRRIGCNPEDYQPLRKRAQHEGQRERVKRAEAIPAIAISADIAQNLGAKASRADATVKIATAGSGSLCGPYKVLRNTTKTPLNIIAMLCAVGIEREFSVAIPAPRNTPTIPRYEPVVSRDRSVCEGGAPAVDAEVTSESLSITRAICGLPCDYGHSGPQSRCGCLSGFRTIFTRRRRTIFVKLPVGPSALSNRNRCIRHVRTSGLPTRPPASLWQLRSGRFHHSATKDVLKTMVH